MSPCASSEGWGGEEKRKGTEIEWSGVERKEGRKTKERRMERRWTETFIAPPSAQEWRREERKRTITPPAGEEEEEGVGEDRRGEETEWYLLKGNPKEVQIETKTQTN